MKQLGKGNRTRSCGLSYTHRSSVINGKTVGNLSSDNLIYSTVRPVEAPDSAAFGPEPGEVRILSFLSVVTAEPESRATISNGPFLSGLLPDLPNTTRNHSPQFEGNGRQRFCEWLVLNY